MTTGFPQYGQEVAPEVSSAMMVPLHDLQVYTFIFAVSPSAHSVPPELSHDISSPEALFSSTL
jgi:hypothetical protein